MRTRTACKEDRCTRDGVGPKRLHFIIVQAAETKKKGRGNRSAKKVCYAECVGSHPVGQWFKGGLFPRMNCCNKKIWMWGKQERRMVHARYEWQGFVREGAWGLAPGMNS